MFRFGLLFSFLALLLLAACSQAPATPVPATQASVPPAPGAPVLLDDIVMLRMALHYGWSPRPYIEMTGSPTEVRASQVITYEEAVKLKGGTLYPDTGDYQRKDDLVRLYVFRGDITGLTPKGPPLQGRPTSVSIKLAQTTVIVNASTGQGMGSSARSFEAELDVSTLELIDIPDDIYSMLPVTMAPQTPVTAAPPATPAPKAPDETPMPKDAPTSTPSPRTTLSCSGREEGPPCGPGVEIGKTYAYSLYTHCGVRAAFLDGRRWVADPVLSDNGNVNPPLGWGNPMDHGNMELVTPDLAQFTSASGSVAEFRPLPDGEEYPWRPCA